MRLLIKSLIFSSAIAPMLVAAATSKVDSPRDYVVHAWQTDNGLPQNWVSSIAQTPDGYLWIGTRYGGLARFDGVRFTGFNQQNTPALKDVQVERLSVDETGRLWVMMGNESITALQDGEFKLYHQPRSEPRMRLNRALRVVSNHVLFASDTVQPSPVPVLDLSGSTNAWRLLFPPEDIKHFALNRAGEIWFLTQNGHLGWLTNNQLQLATNISGLPGPAPALMALASDANRQMWAAGPRNIFFWNGEQFEKRTPANGAAPQGIQQIALCGDGGVWVFESNRLRKFLKGEWVAEVNPEEFRSDAGSLYGDADGNAWVVSKGKGLWHVKADGTAHLLTEKSGLPSTSITCWFQDSERNVWVGTAGGVARIRESVFHVRGEPEGLNDKIVRSVCVDARGELWAGTLSGGLAHWQDGNFVNVPLPAVGASPTESVTVFPESNGDMWVGTLNHKLMRLHDGIFTFPDIPWNEIRVLFGDSKGQLWVGGLVNLRRLNNGISKEFGPNEGFVNHAIGCMAEDARGAIWIGTGPGELWKFADDKFTRFSPPAEWPSVRFSAVLPDTNGVVWVGTLGGGLLRLAGGQFTRCTKLDGLPDDNISQLLDSHDGHIWAGTYAGIFRTSKHDLESALTGRETRVPCRVYGRFDGLRALECSSGFQPSSWRSTDGHLHFSTANGVVSVNPEEVTVNPVPPTVIIEEMQVDGRTHPLRRSSPSSKTTRTSPPEKIAPGRHYVQFRFTGLNFTAPDGVRFRVKLEGAEGDWQSTGERTKGYGPLLPGNYRFRVVACNNDGVWNEKGDAFSFTVLPYFWETWWFKFALGLVTLMALGTTVGLAQRRRYRRKLERVEHQHEMERERTRIAQDLHDDLGTSLTQISMLSALANRDPSLPAEARENIRQVRGCAREMVTALDEIVWAVNPKNDSLVELVSYLGHFAEEFYRPTGIRCRLDFPTQLPQMALAAESRHHLFLAFKEAINNAARHSGATEVDVRVQVNRDEIVICVQDNGRGLAIKDNEQPPVGDGLNNMRKRMEQLDGHTTVTSTPGKGTTITMHAPLMSV